jgi:YVTN family beta-propeller protein
MAAGAVAAAMLMVLFPGVGPATGQAAPPAGRLFVANSGSDTVSVIDTATNTVVATIPVGDRPTGVAAAPSGSRVYVTNEISGTVSVINPATSAVVATVPVGVRPIGVAVSPLGGEVWVTNAGSHNVSIISTATNAAVATVPVGIAPHGVAFSANGLWAYVTSQADTVSVLDTTTRAVTATVPVGHTPFGVVVVGNEVYVTNQSSDTVSVIDAAANVVVDEIEVATDPTGIVASPTGDLVYVANKSTLTISVISVARGTTTDPVLGQRPHSLAISPDGKWLYATGTAATGGIVTVTRTNDIMPVGDSPEGIAFVAATAPVVAGQSWYSDGTKSRTGPSGSSVAVYAVGATKGVPYQLVLSRNSQCSGVVEVLNPATVVPGPSGLIGTVRTWLPATPPGTYWLCFRHTAGATTTRAVTFIVT